MVASSLSEQPEVPSDFAGGDVLLGHEGNDHPKTKAVPRLSKSAPLKKVSAISKQDEFDFVVHDKRRESGGQYRGAVTTSRQASNLDDSDFDFEHGESNAAGEAIRKNETTAVFSPCTRAQDKSPRPRWRSTRAGVPIPNMILTTRKLDKPRGLSSAVPSDSRIVGSANADVPFASPRPSDKTIPKLITTEGQMTQSKEALAVAANSSLLNVKPKRLQNSSVSADTPSPLVRTEMVLSKSDAGENSNAAGHTNGGKINTSLATDDASVLVDEDDYCVMLSVGPQPLPDIPLSDCLLSTAKRTADESVWRFDGLDPSDAVSRSKKRKEVPSRITIHHSSQKVGASRVKKARVAHGRAREAPSRFVSDLPSNTKGKGTTIYRADGRDNTSTACGQKDRDSK